MVMESYDLVRTIVEVAFYAVAGIAIVSAIIKIIKNKKQ